MLQKVQKPRTDPFCFSPRKLQRLASKQTIAARSRYSGALLDAADDGGRRGDRKICGRRGDSIALTPVQRQMFFRRDPISIRFPFAP
jgi:hypothetical protein